VQLLQLLLLLELIRLHLMKFLFHLEMKYDILQHLHRLHLLKDYFNADSSTSILHLLLLNNLHQLQQILEPKSHCFLALNCALSGHDPLALFNSFTITIPEPPAPHMLVQNLLETSYSS
jgi:hypothetical protein